jgi:hypothetical protein
LNFFAIQRAKHAFVAALSVSLQVRRCLADQPPLVNQRVDATGKEGWKRMEFRRHGLQGLTPSSAAVFKLWFYGILLRSKTIKPRLKNCPVQRSGTVLQRLVMHLFFMKMVNMPCFTIFKNSFN